MNATAASGYTLQVLETPHDPAHEVWVRFRVLDPHGTVVTDFRVASTPRRRQGHAQHGQRLDRLVRRARVRGVVRAADRERFPAGAVEGDDRAVVHGLQELAPPDLGDQFVCHSSLHRCAVDCRQLTSRVTSPARRRS